MPGADSFPRTLLVMTSFPAWAGVWIFFLLSGYSIGYGFFINRYNLYDASGKLSLRKVGDFYARRFLKIAPLYYLYCGFFEIVSGQRYLWENPIVLIRMLTFTYNGAPGINGLGHLWYISSAMQLYLIMPAVYLLIRNLPIKTTECLSLAAIFIGGGVRVCLSVAGADWYTAIYTNALANIDLIFIGMTVAKIKVTGKRTTPENILKMAKAIAWIMFFALTIVNMYLYGVAGEKELFVYRMILPSFYALIGGVLLLLPGGYPQHYAGPLAVFERCIAGFAKHSYTFYIMHIAVFCYLQNTLTATAWYGKLPLFAEYVTFEIVGFGITLTFAAAVDSMTSKPVQNVTKMRRTT